MLLEPPAFSRLTRLLPPTTEEDRRQAIRATIRAYNAAGITAVREPGLDAVGMRSFQAVAPEERSLRLGLMWRVDLTQTDEQRLAWLEGLAPISGFGDEWLHVWGLKITLDGGVEGGYFYEPYANDPSYRGLPLTSQESLDAFVQRAHQLGWRVGIHVVGDAAMDMALAAFERADGEQTPVAGRGHALEHAFTPRPEAFERVKRLGLGVTVQHALIYSLGGNMRTYWGQERAANCTPTRAWADSGVVVGAGTDSPVTNFDPWLNMYGFVTRDTDVAGVLGAEHRITAAEALRLYTMGSAAILGESDRLGSLETGKLADFICVDRDPLTASADALRGTKVLRTVVGGREVFRLG
jgi:predicted amidohydrolase YtcJ